MEIGTISLLSFIRLSLNGRHISAVRICTAYSMAVMLLSSELTSALV
jgi:hypothetical protein